MSAVIALPVARDPFTASRAEFDKILGRMEDDQTRSLSHGELEDLLAVEGRELLRQLFQDHLTLRASTEPRLEVVDADGLPRVGVEENHRRALTTVFGEVEVARKAYRRRDASNLHPADGKLNLPKEKYSHGVRRIAAIEAARGSYEGAAGAIERQTGQRIGKLQLEQLAARAATDFDEFYRQSARMPCPADAVLVITCDGKGIVMRPDSLRDATRKAAGRGEHKLATRLSKGEKANRKRMAEVGCVYDVAPVVRTTEDILPSGEGGRPAAPRAYAKWTMASVKESAATVVTHLFDEADRRDPRHQRRWIALVDGNNHQIDLIIAEARRREVDITIVVDVVHVIEYLWKAAWCFHNEGDSAAEDWVREKLLAVLEGKASTVAAAIRRTATRRALSGGQRRTTDLCADYILNKRPYLDYPRALTAGWPIATGVIEGACRHLVKDRMDITGARWGLEGAEAVLKLRALLTNGDFEAYWNYHCINERRRIHDERYAANSIPSQR